eukprot:6731963-Heterocapsa_arctica.AAC.1
MARKAHSGYQPAQNCYPVGIRHNGNPGGHHPKPQILYNVCHYGWNYGQTVTGGHLRPCVAAFLDGPKPFPDRQ